MIIHDHEQGTHEWFAARLGKPTGSKASSMITSAGASPEPKTLRKYADKLAADKFAGEDTDGWLGNTFTAKGHEVEPMARAWYAFQRDTDVREVGFCTDDLMRYGASPDGLVGDEGAVEFKCLPKEHVASLLYIERHGRAPTSYVAQCHMEMLVCEREWTDLVFFHETLPKKVFRVARNEKFLATLRNQIALCIERRDETLSILRNIEEAA